MFIATCLAAFAVGLSVSIATHNRGRIDHRAIDASLRHVQTQRVIAAFDRHDISL